MGVTLNGAVPESIFTGAIVGGKNAIINGGMDIWQRGTSISVPASTTVYVADRWQVNPGANAANTVARIATGDTTNLPNIQYGIRVQRNSGQTGTTTEYLAQALETTNSIPFAGKQVTLSFYARAGANFSSGSNILISAVNTGTGTDQAMFSFSGQISTPQNNTLTTTWQRFTQTLTIPTTATQLGIAIGFTPTGTAGANDYFEITGIQLELGSTATTFSRAGGTLQGELAACQRYYQTAGAGAFGAFDGNSTTLAIVEKLSVPMRANPSVAVISGISAVFRSNGNDFTNSSPVIANLSVTGNSSFWTQVQGFTGGTTGYPVYSRNASSFSGAFLSVSAEL